jgi:hypothetical protein
MTSETSHPLHVTDADLDFYRDNGYFIYNHQLLPRDKFDRLKTVFDGLYDNLSEGERPEAMDVPHFSHPELFEWLMDKDVLDFVEQFIGPNIAVWSSHFLCKPPARGLRVPWHEDSAYWAGRLSEFRVLTVWLAIDDSDLENGCMRIIPGTHDHGFSDYAPVNAEEHVFDQEIVADQVDDDQAVDLVVRAGQCHIHHAKTIHGSNPNTSDRRRCGYTMRYMPTTTKVIMEDPDEHAIYLARGKDLAGNEYGDPTKKFSVPTRMRTAKLKGD